MCKDRCEDFRPLHDDLGSASISPQTNQTLQHHPQHLAVRLKKTREVRWSWRDIKTLKKEVATTIQQQMVVTDNTPCPSESSSQIPGGKSEMEPKQSIPLPVFLGIASPLFHKLPNPLTNLIQLLPVMNGQEESKLLSYSYLHILFQLSYFPGKTDRAFLELIVGVQWRRGWQKQFSWRAIPSCLGVSTNNKSRSCFTEFRWTTKASVVLWAV